MHLSVLPEAVASPSSWLHRWVIGSEIVFSVAKIGNQFLLRLDDGQTFGFDDKTRTVSCPFPLGSLGRHQLLDHVLPRVLDHLGHLMVHASAVSTPWGSVVFVGEAGAGKSSIAASFHEAGFDLLTDDGVRLAVEADHEVRCVPTYPSLRLWPDSADAVAADRPFKFMSPNTNKRRMTLESTSTTSETRVAAVCVLADNAPASDRIEISHLTPSQAVARLLAQSFRLDPTDADATKRVLDQCARVVERIPVVELHYPREYGRLPDVRNAVMRFAAECVGAAPIPV